MKTLIVTSLLAGVGAATLASAAREEPAARVHMQNAERRSVGDVMLHETPNGLRVVAELRGLPQGQHAFHVHETGKCEPPFESAGDHFNPGGVPHGFASAKGPHAGDLPNLHVPSSGDVKVEFLVPGLTLREGKTGLLDADGAAFVIHSGPDDHRTDPAGGAGDRIACGVVK